ncbi:tyrosine-type recombinase/integrase [Streptomyces misionensis]|uniref:tyrosine-type recombinase/integrase n=1 Tax=Streptomyces misionensis TaxID=67331 RepID=UPI0033ACB4E4
MASVISRTNKNGEVVSHQVRWRLGGGRTAPWQTERFDGDEEGRKAADVFCGAVNECGQQWPPGWVKGVGYVDPNAGETDERRYRFREYALAFVANKTGVEEHYREACKGDLERWIFPTFENCDVRSVEHFSHDTIQAWVRKLEQTNVYRGQKPKKGEPKWRKMSPKTIRNLHGLLSSVLQRAVESEPPLRARNPCELTNLPRTDDDGAEGGEDIEFLTPDEVEGVISCMERRKDQLLSMIKYGTGVRWGEVTALAPECLIGWKTGRPKIRIKRAWKKDGQGGYYLGPPKSKRSRRTIRVSQAVVEAIEELGGEDDENGDCLYFTGDRGQRLHYSTFYDRWKRAVRRAKELGLLPKHKNPTPHDLRHSHAAVLISEGRGLTYVQRRLGHESIKTTSDTYGHLLPEADDDAMTAIDRSLGRAPGGPARSTTPAREAAAVHVVLFPDGRREGFWNPDIARLVAEVWRIEHDQAPLVQAWPILEWEHKVRGGIGTVRAQTPERVRVYFLGPAVYGPDGEEQVTAPDAHELRSRWLWEWEPEFTTASAHTHAEHRPAPSTQTEACAWGVDQDEVRKAYVLARAKALQMCGAHPALAGDAEREAAS